MRSDLPNRGGLIMHVESWLVAWIATLILGCYAIKNGWLLSLRAKNDCGEIELRTAETQKTLPDENIAVPPPDDP